MAEAWPVEREELLIRMWEVDGMSASQCAAALGGGLTRNAIIGKVHRLKLARRGKSSIAARSRSGGNGAAGKYRGAVTAARRARAAKAAPPKPDRIKLPPPEVFTPDASDLAVGAWNAVPGTIPVTLELLARDGCRWPIGEDSPFLFCGCKAASGSSYCATHRHRSQGVGTPSEQSATKSARSMVRLEASYGFRSNQAGQSL
jgi:GcrA cell cycle regulator